MLCINIGSKDINIKTESKGFTTILPNATIELTEKEFAVFSRLFNLAQIVTSEPAPIEVVEPVIESVVEPEPEVEIAPATKAKATKVKQPVKRNNNVKNKK